MAECSYLEVASEYRWLCFAHRFHVQHVGDKGTSKPRRASGHCNPHLGRLWQWSQVAGDSPNLLTASSLRSASCHPRFKWWSCENLGSQPRNSLSEVSSCRCYWPTRRWVRSPVWQMRLSWCRTLSFLRVMHVLIFLYISIYCIYIYIMFMYTSFWNAPGIFGC